MLKNILNLEGAAQLGKAQQSHIFGGNDQASISDGKCTKKSCSSNSDCGSGVCATYSGDPCSAWGVCGCGQYCL